jgi:endonuclease/exonuclease/phosphatase family metal-dependent hydrolase
MNADTFTVMSYNIRYDNEQDGNERWEHRKEAVGAVIRRFMPDIIGIQEGLSHQIGDIEKLLPGYAWSGTGRDDGKKAGEFTAIFFNTNTTRLLGGSTFWLSGEPDVPGSNTWGNACIRTCTWVKMHLLDLNRSLLFMNVHADHQNVVARHESARLVVERMASLSIDVPAIVAGDFNAIDDKQTIKTMKAGYGGKTMLDARDTWMKRTGARLPRYTWHDIYNPRKSKLLASLTTGLLDFVFFTQGLVLAGFQVHDKQVEGRWPSDHFPLVARFSFPAK